MRRNLGLFNLIVAVSVIIWCTGCDDHSHDVHEEHDEFKKIEHACIHMQDEGTVLEAESSKPGPHLDEDEWEHTRLKVVLVKESGDDYSGYIHLGPDITGDMYIMTDKNIPIALTNRTNEGDTELEIEETFTAEQISESANCTLLKKAVIFEAQTGGNIIKIGPTTSDTVSVLIEEGDHEH